MKKTLIAALMMAVIMTATAVFAAGAGSTPAPLVVSVYPAANVDVSVTQLRTGDVLVKRAVSYGDHGEAAFELSNLENLQTGDQFRVETDGQTSTVTYTGGQMDVQKFGITVIPANTPTCNQTCPEQTPINETTAVAYIGGLLTAGGVYTIRKSRAKKTPGKITTTKK